MPYCTEIQKLAAAHALLRLQKQAGFGSAIAKGILKKTPKAVGRVGPKARQVAGRTNLSGDMQQYVDALNRSRPRNAVNSVKRPVPATRATGPATKFPNNQLPVKPLPKKPAIARQGTSAASQPQPQAANRLAGLNQLSTGSSLVDKGIEFVGGSLPRAGINTAKLPFQTVSDAVKAIPEAVGATASLSNPKRLYDYYRQANPGMSMPRNLLRDVSGYGKEQMPGFGYGKFRYEPKSKAGQIGTELASTMWNPRMPSARVAGGMSRRGFGQGQGIGRPLVAAGAGTGGYAIGNAAYQNMLDAPLTGNKEIDSSIPQHVRKKMNKEMMKSLPRLLWSAYGKDGNPVDKSIRDDFIQNLFYNVQNEGLDYAQSLGNAGATSGRKLFLNQTIGRLANMQSKAKKFTSTPTFESLNKLRNSKSLSTEDLQNSSLATTLKAMALASDPAGNNYQSNLPSDQISRRDTLNNLGNVVGGQVSQVGRDKFKGGIAGILKQYNLSNPEIAAILENATQ